MAGQNLKGQEAGESWSGDQDRDTGNDVVNSERDGSDGMDQAAERPAQQADQQPFQGP